MTDIIERKHFALPSIFLAVEADNLEIFHCIKCEFFISELNEDAIIQQLC